MVPFYDPKSKKVVQIPKAELSPSAIFVSLQGYGKVYIDAQQAKVQDKFVQPPFEGEARAAIETLVHDLADVYPMSYRQWEDGFRCEPRPDKEIAGWIHLAGILSYMSKERGFDLGRRKECMGVLLACFNGPRDTVLARCRVRLLSSDEVSLVIRYWYEGGYSKPA